MHGFQVECHVEGGALIFAYPSGLYKQAHLGIWDLRRREAWIVNRNIFEFRGQRCTTDPSKL